MKHSDLVRNLFKDPESIRSSLSAPDCNLLHAILGISGEAGELLDAIKKCVIYRKPLDLTNVIEELGDIEFYLEALRQHLDLSRDDILAANVTKLLKRYPTGYSDTAAQARADKAPESSRHPAFPVCYNCGNDFVSGEPIFQVHGHSFHRTCQPPNDFPS